MALGLCPKCNKLIDIDGYVEHSVPTLFYCECGVILDMPKFGELVEVPKDEIDLSGLEGKIPISSARHNPGRANEGIFIKKSRWKP